MCGIRDRQGSGEDRAGIGQWWFGHWTGAGWRVGTEQAAARIRAYIVDNFLLGADDGFDEEASLLQSGVLDSTGVMEC